MTSFLQHLIDHVTPVAAVVVDGGWLEVDTTRGPRDVRVAARAGHARSLLRAHRGLSAIRGVVRARRRGARRFEKLDAATRTITFYAEDGAYWPHFEPIVRELTGPMGREICYLTSSADDPDPRARRPAVHAFEIGEGFGRAYLFQTMEVGVLVATVPAARHLGAAALEAARPSSGPHYVYVFHSMVSTHMIYEPDGFDHYDTVCCVGPYMVDEIRRREQEYGLPAKELVEHGYGRLDAILVAAATRPARGPRERPAGRARRAVVGTDVHLRDVRRGAGARAPRRGLRGDRPPAPDDREARHRRRSPRSPTRSASHRALHARHRHRGTGVAAPLRPHGERLVGRRARVRVRTRTPGAVRRRPAQGEQPGVRAARDRAVRGDRSASRSAASSRPSELDRAPALVDEMVARRGRFRDGIRKTREAQHLQRRYERQGRGRAHRREGRRVSSPVEERGERSTARALRDTRRGCSPAPTARRRADLRRRARRGVARTRPGRVRRRRPRALDALCRQIDVRKKVSAGYGADGSGSIPRRRPSPAVVSGLVAVLLANAAGVGEPGPHGASTTAGA